MGGLRKFDTTGYIEGKRDRVQEVSYLISLCEWKAEHEVGRIAKDKSRLMDRKL